MDTQGTIEKVHNDFATQGPWAVMTLILIVAIGFAVWKIYTKMHASLDTTTKALLDQNEKHADKLEKINERSITSIDNNTEVMRELSSGRVDIRSALKKRKDTE